MSKSENMRNINFRSWFQILAQLSAPFSISYLAGDVFISRLSGPDHSISIFIIIINIIEISAETTVPGLHPKAAFPPKLLASLVSGMIDELISHSGSMKLCRPYMIKHAITL